MQYQPEIETGAGGRRPNLARGEIGGFERNLARRWTPSSDHLLNCLWGTDPPRAATCLPGRGWSRSAWPTTTSSLPNRRGDEGKRKRKNKSQFKARSDTHPVLGSVFPYNPAVYPIECTAPSPPTGHPTARTHIHTHTHTQTHTLTHTRTPNGNGEFCSSFTAS